MIRKTPRVTEEATYTEPGCREGGHVLHPSSPLHLSEWGVSLHLLYRDLLWVSSILGSGSPSGGLWTDGAKFHEREHHQGRRYSVVPGDPRAAFLAIQPWPHEPVTSWAAAAFPDLFAF